MDYGEEHSKACGHSQFGRIYEQGLRKRPSFYFVPPAFCFTYVFDLITLVFLE